MFCWKCNSQIRVLEDGWLCMFCGQHGPDETPVSSLREGITENRPLENPYDNS